MGGVPVARIGILTAYDVAELNRESVLFRVCETLGRRHEIELIGTRKTSDRIRNRWPIFLPADWHVPFGGPLKFLNSAFGRVGLVRRFIRERKPDVLIVTSGIGSNGFTVALAGKLEGVPAVSRVTSDIFEVYKHHKDKRLSRRLFLKNNVFGRLTLFLSRKVILLHEAQKQQLVARGYAADKFFVCPQPIQFPQDSPGGKALRDELGVPDTAYLIGSIGRLEKDKNLELLADTLEMALEKDPDVYALVVGRGSMEPYLRNRLKSDRVIFVAQKPRDELADFYQACDVIIQTSGSEGLSSVIAESLYFKTPVLSTDSGVITRAIVTNIENTPERLCQRIIDRDIKLDPLPETLRKETNEKLWLGLIDTVLEAREKQAD